MFRSVVKLLLKRKPTLDESKAGFLYRRKEILKSGGIDGTRTRDLRRDRPAF
tara:strand:+ start:235 stop:390 length:156 start_codon:yes stop_codon:yes gene_type:complete